MMNVRRVRERDLTMVARMAKGLATSVADPAPKLSKSSLRAMLLGRRRWVECVVAVEDGNIVGYAIAARMFEPHTAKRELRISDLFVDERARSSGAGRLLFECLTKMALSLRCSQITWEVWIENDAAYAFYEHLGAEHVSDVSAMRLNLA